LHRGRAGCWAIIGVLSFIFGWANSVALVWAASVYANVVSDIGAAEAADDRRVTDRLDRIERILLLEMRRRRFHRRLTRRYLRH
jgi:hypothetical protein